MQSNMLAPTNPSSTRSAKTAWIPVILGAACMSTAQAGELYAGIGLPGVMVGFAQPLSPSATLRVDISTLGTHSKSKFEQGINYNATLKTNRIGLFGDWFVGQSSFRLTGGLTANDFKADLTGGGTGSSITIGNNTYAFTSGDRFDVQIKIPRTTPYLGIGWGHQQAEKGWGFHADMGASIGKATVTSTVSGQLANLVSQTDIDAELAQIRDSVGKVKFLPQLSVGVSYRF